MSEEKIGMSNDDLDSLDDLIEKPMTEEEKAAAAAKAKAEAEAKAKAEAEARAKAEAEARRKQAGSGGMGKGILIGLVVAALAGGGFFMMNGGSQGSTGASKGSTPSSTVNKQEKSMGGQIPPAKQENTAPKTSTINNSSTTSAPAALAVNNSTAPAPKPAAPQPAAPVGNANISCTVIRSYAATNGKLVVNVKYYNSGSRTGNVTSTVFNVTGTDPATGRIVYRGRLSSGNSVAVAANADRRMELALYDGGIKSGARYSVSASVNYN